ncbi:MAG: SOS response-associated peptidase [Anaerolineae bacterium]|nr:SOS response-associated peptidase [Anaerolineae bacterium]
MCGRFTLSLDLDDLIAVFPDFVFPPDLKPRYNVAPTQDIAVVPNTGDRQVTMFHWGLVPSWAKDTAIGARMINARSETLAEKPSFRAAYKRRRCLILADGFYEWRKAVGRGPKTPMLVKLASGKPFAFAGLWEVWRPDDTPIFSCTIITTTPNELVQPIHDRMPVILPPAAYDLWLAPGEQSASVLQSLLKPYPAVEMVAYEVSRLVNSPRNDSPECIVPVEAP